MEGTTTLKASWDARQEFTKSLVELLKQTKDVLQDHQAWFKLVRTYYSLTQPFMDKKVKKDVKAKLDKVYNLLINENKSKINNYSLVLEKLLYESLDELMNATSHLLLDVEVDAEDIDDESWLD